MNWIDETAYNTDECGKEDPRTWSAKIGPITIIVTRHIYWPRTWLMYCRQLHLDQENLHTNDVDTAKSLAIVRIKELVLSYHEALKGVEV